MNEDLTDVENSLLRLNLSRIGITVDSGLCPLLSSSLAIPSSLNLRKAERTVGSLGTLQEILTEDCCSIYTLSCAILNLLVSL